MELLSDDPGWNGLPAAKKLMNRLPGADAEL